jgi:hypothetical protein
MLLLATALTTPFIFPHPLPTLANSVPFSQTNTHLCTLRRVCGGLVCAAHLARIAEFCVTDLPFLFHMLSFVKQQFALLPLDLFYLVDPERLTCTGNPHIPGRIGMYVHLREEEGGGPLQPMCAACMHSPSVVLDTPCVTMLVSSFLCLHCTRYQLFALLHSCRYGGKQKEIQTAFELADVESRNTIKYAGAVARFKLQTFRLSLRRDATCSCPCLALPH